MRKLQRLAVVALTTVMALGSAGCVNSGSSSSSSKSTSSSTSNKHYKIGICQLVQHEALDAATKGFKAEVKKELGAKNVTFDEQNAQGDSSTASTICTNFASEKVDLILANATASLQAATAATKSIPILGTAVTNYQVALNLKKFNGTVGGNVSGTSDLAPLDKQEKMIKDFVPKAKKLGILYCSAEPNSKYQAKEVAKYAKKDGYKVTEYTFSDTNDVNSVTRQAASGSDVIYIPTDNTAASCAKTINNVALKAKVPIIAGEEGIMSKCGVATLSIDYYGLGKQTGKMAAEILSGKEKVAKMPVEYYTHPVKEYNPTICKELGIKVPAGYKAYKGS